MGRSVQLPTGVPGELILHSMPGRYEALEETWKQIAADGVQLVVSLSAPDEIHRKSPTYGAALASKTVPCAVELFPIADRGVPEDRPGFWSLASRVARQLKAGSRVLIHCGAGIGRTGTLAICVLLALGESQASATRAVSAAGSHPETDGQRDLVAWCAAQRQGPK